MDNPELIRRPLKTRGAKWAAKSAQRLAKIGFRPNQISLLSIVCAMAAATCFLAVNYYDSPNTKILYLIGAAVFIQLRLLCNLFDGMVAVEGGFRSKSGEVYNDLPDRISDVLIMVAVGYSLSDLRFGIVLGWIAAILSLLTAYVRVLAGSCGVKQDFCGPMAKPHRMATLTFACILAVGEILLQWPSRVLIVALGVIAVGSIITVARRASRLVQTLESK
ncbi:MAG: CDP-alcohol phosphatidyltransferase family protein [Verrucomicrobia bacterium]|nr:CDP-alcohol phosphatidyltransferase family protein [Verrucomicrobiota bacterium]